MSLFNYHAVQTALELSKDITSKWKLHKDNICEIEATLEPYINDDKLVLTPRFNGHYISFRYCGLEVIRLSRKGTWETRIELTKGQIRGTTHAKEVSKLSELNLGPLLERINQFVNHVIKDSTHAIKRKKQEKIVPGFSLEHWLESAILADNALGHNARASLGLSQNLSMVVSQVPVIIKPLKAVGRHRHLHIDLLGIGADGRIIVVELKKDNDLPKALTELEIYTNWLLRKSDEVHQERGNPIAMVSEHYLPDLQQMRNEIKSTDIEAIAVVVKPSDNTPAQLSNGVRLRAIGLPVNWLSCKTHIFPE